MTDLGTAILNNKLDEAQKSPYYGVFIVELNNQIISANLMDDKGNALTTVAQVASYIESMKKQYYADLENKPLLTFSADGGFNTDGKFGRGNLGGIFLVGNSVGELDARAKFSYADTLSTGLVRTNINAKLGYNFKVLKHTDGASYFEIKGYAEYNKILKNPLPDEEEETWLANAEIRIRLMDDLWLPITIKYDVENANVLGFLNITYNFGDD